MVKNAAEFEKVTGDSFKEGVSGGPIVGLMGYIVKLYQPHTLRLGLTNTARQGLVLH